MAQLVARLVRIEEVRSSNLLSSTRMALRGDFGQRGGLFFALFGPIDTETTRFEVSRGPIDPRPKGQVHRRPSPRLPIACRRRQPDAHPSWSQQPDKNHSFREIFHMRHAPRFSRTLDESRRVLASTQHLPSVVMQSGDGVEVAQDTQFIDRAKTTSTSELTRPARERPRTCRENSSSSRMNNVDSVSGWSRKAEASL
jgi:hypothetical protein